MLIADCLANRQPKICNQQFYYDVVAGLRCSSVKKCNGVVAKWQGKGLQNPDQGFKSPRRLKKSEIHCKSGPKGPLFALKQVFGGKMGNL
jgi:hypothetical protein